MSVCLSLKTKVENKEEDLFHSMPDFLLTSDCSMAATQQELKLIWCGFIKTILYYSWPSP